jgi:UDP-4-keto-D-QuiNAc 4-reductase
MKVLVTGATGFVGGALVRRLVRDGVTVRAACRSRPAVALDAEVVCNLDVASHTDWAGALDAIDVVVHCAARVHVMRERELDPLAQFRSCNVDGTLALASQAAAAGVRRFVLVSSIGVHGAMTTEGRPFHPEDVPAPHSPYAISKLEAEEGLRSLAERTSLEIVVVRPPLVYGPGAPGNFARLLHAVRHRWPLPFGSVHNQRSLISLDNLVDVLTLVCHHPAASGAPLLVSDGHDISTTSLLRQIGVALGSPPRLLSVPERILRGGLRLVGRHELILSLVDSLQIDISATRDRLAWSPPQTLEEGLRRAASQCRPS